VTKQSAPDPSDAESFPYIWNELEARRRRLVERGDALEILHAIRLCAYHGVRMPSWLADVYCRKFDAFMRAGTAASLDEVFHSAELPTSTAKKHAAALRDWSIGVELWMAVKTVAGLHTAMDGALAEVLKQKNWGVGKTKARELVEWVDRTHGELGRVKTLSQIWAIRRKQMHQK